MDNHQVIYNEIDTFRREIKDNNFNNIFLLTGGKSYIESGGESIIHSVFENCNIERHIVENPNPKIAEIKKHLEAFDKSKYDAIITIGGGSVIDTGKCIKDFSENNTDVKLIAIPTTAGSGSESTPFAVYYDDNNLKISLDKKEILPDIVLLESKLLLSLSKYQKACTSMDAFCQALESLWAKKSNNQSEEYSIKALNIIIENIIEYVNNPNDDTCNQMMIASNFAGKAIAISRTTLSHALSYTITSKYNIPHGHAVALTIPSVLKYNMVFTNTNKQNILRKVFKVTNIIDIAEIILNIMKSIGLETKFSQLGITDIEEIARSVNIERLKNNPAQPSYNDIIKILKDVV